MKDYVKALVGICPTILLWTYCGASVKELTSMQASVDGEAAQLYGIVLIATGIVFGAVAAILIWWYSMEKLKKLIDMDAAESWWRYKKMPSKAGDGAASAAVATPEPLDEEGQEVVAHRTRQGQLYGVLPIFGIRANGLEGHYPGAEDASDQEWFWIWA